MKTISIKTILKYFSILFLLNVHLLACSQEYKTHPIERCQKIAEVCDKLNLGFPFNDAKRLGYNGYTYLIAQRVEELEESKLLDVKSVRVSLLRDIIHDNWKRAKCLPLEGYYNYGAFDYQEKEVDTSLLLAAIVIAGKKGEIVEIEPFLEFVTLFFGTSYESKTCSTAMHTDYLYNKDLTNEQSKHFWPAADAILSNKEIVVPLLAEAVLNEKNPDILRLRAVAFLNELDPEKLKEVRLNQVKDEKTAGLINCVLDRKLKWKSVYPGVCEYKSDPETAKRLMARDEFLRQRDKELHKKNN